MVEANQCNTRDADQIINPKLWINCPFCDYAHRFPLRGGCPLIEAKRVILKKDRNYYDRWVDVMNAISEDDLDEEGRKNN